VIPKHQKGAPVNINVKMTLREVPKTSSEQETARVSPGHLILIVS
jgi:hypothetical protein